MTVSFSIRHTLADKKSGRFKRERFTDHADIRVLLDQGTQQLHLLMQVVSPHFAYPLPGNALCTVLRATHLGILLQLGTVSKTQARFVAVQSGSSTYPAKRCCRAEACRTAAYAGERRI